LTAHMKNVHNQPLGEFRILKAANAVTHPKRFEQDSQEKSPRMLLPKLISEGHVKVGETEKTLNIAQDEKVTFDNCTICGDSITGGTAEALNAHALLKHKGRMHQCSNCEHAFKYKLNLTDHKMRKHQLDPPSGLTMFMCQSCPYNSLCKEYIERHFRSKHSNKAAGSKTTKKTSDGEGRYQCHLCGKGFANKSYVDEHIARTHNKIKKVNCPYPDCKFTAYDKTGLKTHLKIHTTTLEDRKAFKGFTCQECGARSLFKGHLINHIKAVHRKVKEYGCKICHLRFNNKGNCKEHIGLKHMGFKDAKEWRLKENAEVRKSAETHQAYEYIPDQEWEEEYKQLMQK